MKSKQKLTLEQRVELACNEGLWRTYSETYTHKDLDRFNVPKTYAELNSEQLKCVMSIS